MGSILCDKELLKETVAEIVAYGPEKAGVILMGDYGEFIPKSDRRFDPTNVDPEVINLYSGRGIEEQTVEKLVDYLSPLAPQVLCALGGNHGLQNKATGEYERWDWAVARAIGCEHLFTGYSAFVRLQFEAERGGAHRSILCHVHHGRQAGRTQGSLINQLEREISYFPQADFIVRGHSHHLFATIFTTMNVNQRGTGVQHKNVLVGHSGAFMQSQIQGVESYGERALYRPGVVGALKSWIRFTADGTRVGAGVM